LEVSADRDELISPVPVPTSNSELTLRTLVERYRDTVSIKKRGGEDETIVLNAFLRHPLCSRALGSLATSDFAAYRDERLLSIKPTTLKRQFSPLHNLFEIARDEWGIAISGNPISKVRLDCSEIKRERRLRDNEFDLLIEAASQSRNRLMVPIITLAVETGMRRGEIVAIKSQDLQRAARCLIVPHTKNGYARTIPLTRVALRVLEDLKPNNDLMIPMTANALKHSWQRLTHRAGITDLHFHDLRHEAISRFFEKGLSTPEVALISGHRDMRMLFRYAHPTRQRILDKLDGCYRAVAASVT